MDLDRSGLSTDEYYMTALQIFDYCGTESTGTLRVDALMDKFAPFVKTNKAEYSFLKSLLDPEEENAAIDVSLLAKTLQKYSESQKSKADLDESFNLKSGAPHDSDSGISSDGFQLLEELQCELREKAHLAQQLRSQLDFTDRQHEEALAALTDERDSLRGHLNMLREENLSLSHLRRDYEEVCERLGASDRALDDARRELDTLRRRAKVMVEQVATLENEKLTLQELLTKSKAECHRINEMYATRQSALLEQNEALRAEHADLASRLQDQDEFVQQMIKEKVLLEMELKDMLNKSNQTQLRMDRSIDISYTDDQVLSALDSLNADTRFCSENRILDEESFINTLKEDQGRGTNVSLFDEIRFSLSRVNITESNSLIFDKVLDTSFITVGTQTDEFKPYDEENKDLIKSISTLGTQTDETESINNNNCNSKCLECEKLSRYTTKLERDMNLSHRTVTDMQVEIEQYESNLNILEKFVEEGNERNSVLQSIIKSLESKIGLLEVACAKQTERLDSLAPDNDASIQTKWDQANVSTQVDVACPDCEKRNAVVPHRSLRKFFCV
ncbi:myosin-11-like isoform X2 [Trichoplusia ni]|uniref:Myosin-11-like isoform X2 n=1 Tax=Trichoplusia ni TaxID=7111 RepID=A0A7E5WFM6_TRINI|nr:myosin-11-like isoform X2 [Trichoplusia ni]